jgi:hypothetical protein
MRSFFRVTWVELEFVSGFFHVEQSVGVSKCSSFFLGQMGHVGLAIASHEYKGVTSFS